MNKQLFIILFLLSSCSRSYYDYRFKITNVEKDGKTQSDTLKLEYLDSIISIKWNPKPDGFYFTLYNVSNNSIKIIWDEAAIETIDGHSNRVFHKNVKYNEAEKSQPPSTIIKGSIFEDIICSAEGVQYIAGYGNYPGRWVTKNIYFIQPEDIGEIEAKKILGKVIKVLLPIKHSNNTIEYVFYFKFNEVFLQNSGTTPDKTKTPMDKTIKTLTGVSIGCAVALAVGLLLIGI